MARLFQHSRGRLGLPGCIALALLLLVLTRLGWLDSLYLTRERLLQPFWRVAHWPALLSQKLSYRWQSHQQLAEQNALLRVEKQVLTARLKDLEVSIKENKELRGLLSSSGRVEGSFITADLLAVLHHALGQEWILNRGKKSGVYVGQPVLDAEGVVGQIVSVSEQSSRLLLISDARVHVPAETKKGGIKGILVGVGHHRMKLRYVSDANALQVGDVLLTSGLGLQFPRGYPVGRVIRVRSMPHEAFCDIDVQPIATWSSDRVLLLVWSDLTQAQREAKKWLSGEGV